MGETQQTPHIILVASPGIGHLIPLAEFAKRLIFNHDFLVTILIPTGKSPSKAQETFLNSLPKSINYIILSFVNLDDLPNDTKSETRISYLIARSLSSMRDALKEIIVTSHVVALVADLFATDAFDVAKEFKLSPYIFFPSNATVLSLFLELPKLDKAFRCEYRDLSGPVRLPGSVPFRGSDLVAPTQDRKNEAYSWLLHHCEKYRLAEGIIVNSFMELEPGALKALEEATPGRPPIYPVGPLIRNGGEKCDADGCECLRWLDTQPQGSVLFISFGSGGTLSHKQMTELAIGLEMSKQMFLWVIRRPNDKSANASLGPFDFLPEGFLERTKGFGLVLLDWAPQVQVLSHRSTGGFLTHCGWNSTLESIVHGVPLIAWPLFAEQKMNAVLLEDMKVALRPTFDENGVVQRAEIARVVNILMEGDEGKKLRSKLKDLQGAAVTVSSREGSSNTSLCEVALKWKHQT